MAKQHLVARKQRKRHILFDADLLPSAGDMNIHQHKTGIVARQVVTEVFRWVVRHNVGAGSCFNLLEHFSDIGARQHQSRLCDEGIQRLVEGQHLAARMYFRHLIGLDLAVATSNSACTAMGCSWPTVAEAMSVVLVSAGHIRSFSKVALRRMKQRHLLLKRACVRRPFSRFLARPSNSTLPEAK